MTAAARPNSPTDREIVIDRLIRAPRRLVWNAWLQPGHIEQWWGPDGFTTTTHSADFRQGGIWRFTMHGPDGRDYENRIVFTEFVEPERIAYRHAGEGDEEGIRFDSLVTFEEVGEATLVTLRMTFATAAERDFVAREYGAVEGGEETLGRLAAQVESQLR